MGRSVQGDINFFKAGDEEREVMPLIRKMNDIWRQLLIRFDPAYSFLY
jgi:hypothetical protein